MVAHSKKGLARRIRCSSSRPIVQSLAYIWYLTFLAILRCACTSSMRPRTPKTRSARRPVPPHPIAHVMTFMNYKQCHVDAPLRALYLLPPRPTCTNHPAGYLYKNAGIVFTSASRRTTTRYVPKRNMNHRLVLVDVYSTQHRILSAHPLRALSAEDDH